MVISPEEPKSLPKSAEEYRTRALGEFILSFPTLALTSVLKLPPAVVLGATGILVVDAIRNYRLLSKALEQEGLIHKNRL